MLQCAHCGKKLPNAIRYEHTDKMLSGAACSPLCKIINQLVTIDANGCWLFLRPAFTWACRSFSVKGYVYTYYYNTVLPPKVIYMNCKSPNCANPDHMITYGRPKIRRGNEED